MICTTQAKIKRTFPLTFLVILFYVNAFCQITSESIEQLEIIETFDLRTADSTIQSITIKLNYGIKNEAEQSVLNRFGQDYSNKYIAPLLRITTRKIAFSYSSTELTALESSKLEKRVLDSLVLGGDSSKLFDYTLIKVKSSE